MQPTPEVRAVEARLEHQAVGNLELQFDVLLHAGRGGCGERQHGNAGEPLLEDSQCLVIGPVAGGQTEESGVADRVCASMGTLGNHCLKIPSGL